MQGDRINRNNKLVISFGETASCSQSRGRWPVILMAVTGNAVRFLITTNRYRLPRVEGSALITLPTCDVYSYDGLSALVSEVQSLPCRGDE